MRYERLPLDVKAEVGAEPEDWTDAQVSIAGVYQSERVPIKLLLPKNAAKNDSSHLVIAVPAKCVLSSSIASRTRPCLPGVAIRSVWRDAPSL